MDVKGRDLITGLPKNIVISSQETIEAFQEAANSVLEAIHNVLEITPPELASDISDRGIVLTGGGSLIWGLDRLIEKRTGIHAVIADEPISCVAIGTGLFVEHKYGDKKRR
jgi:rod shape-determining protein MreB